MRSFQTHGDVVRLKNRSEAFYLVSHPDHIRRFLAENAANYPKISSPEGPVLGNGLFESEGAYWRRQRRLIQPAFHRERLAGMVDGMVQSIQRMLDGWEARTGQRLDMAEEMGGLTIDLVCRAVFSTVPDSRLSADLRRLVYIFNHAPPLWAVVARMLRLPVRTQRGKDAAAILKRINALADDVVARRQAGGAEDDVMTMMVAARDADTGEAMTAKELRDEFKNLVIAGHESGGTALTWAWMLLDRHPEVAERLAAESASVLGGRLPTAQDVPKLRYATQVFEESMRLYPPAWRLTRVAKEADTLGGFDVRPGTLVMGVSYVFHRHPEFWESPETFDPDRFAPEKAARRHKFAYLPFGGGQRICIGNNLALMQGTLTLAMAAQRFKVSVAPDWKPAIHAGVVLQPRGGLPVTLTPRA